MSTAYYNFTGQLMATSAAAKAWVNTTGSGQTLTATTTPTQFGDSYGGATLVGGGADSTFYISDSSDTISVSATNVVDTVYSWSSYTLPTNVNNLTLEAAHITGVANSGADLLIALAASDTLVAGSGSDVLVDAGAGGDFFQIGANATTDVIYGFQTSGSMHDTLQLTGSTITNFTDLQSHMTQVGSDTLLTLSSTQQVLIRNTQVSALTASDFAFNVDLSKVATTFDDEFNSISLYNSSTGNGTWKTSFISGNQTGSQSWMSRTLQPNSEQEIYVDPSYAGSGTTALGLNPFSINNGVLTITATNTPTADLAVLNNYKYTSGLLTTEKSFSQTYGYFEMKAELPSGQGVWPAFWMLPADGSWPPELDVMEQIGGKNVYQTSHYVDSSGAAVATGFSSYVPTNATGFHTYGVLWTPKTLAWYVDGVEVATTATPAEMNKPMYMLVNLAVGGNWPGSAPSNFTSAQMEVDYVRAYSLSSLNLSSASTTAPGQIQTSSGATSQPATSAATTTTAPTSVADSYTAKAGTALTVSAAQGVLANDTDHNGVALKATLATGGAPSHGTLALNSDGSFTYTPNAGFAGTDSFTYIPSDSSSTGTATTVTLTVGATAPISKAEVYSVKAGSATTETAALGVLANDVDNNGLALKAALATGGGPSHGTLVLNSDGSFTYTATAGYAGTDSFTYIASDTLGSSTATTVTLNVGATAPTSKADAYGVKVGAAITESAAQGVLANDVDTNGLKLTAALASNGGPSHGSLTLNADGSFTYTANAGYAGTDSFTYIASDSLSAGAATTVTLNVSAAAIVTHSASYSLRENSPLSIVASSGVLSFDSDSNGQTLTATVSTKPTHGTLALNSDGSFTYTPNSGYYGTDSFTYVASDGLTTSSPVTVGLKVAALLPVTHTDYYTTAAGHALSANAASGVQANDSDPNGLAMKTTLVSGGGPAHGTLTLNTDGSFVYTPTSGYAGTDSFKYIATDSVGSSSTTTVNLTMSASAPTGNADTYSATAGKALSISAASGVLANDVDNNGLALSAKVTTTPTHGTVTLDANGSFIYTPNAGFVGTDTFKYTPSDTLNTGYGTLVTVKVGAATTTTATSTSSTQVTTSGATSSPTSSSSVHVATSSTDHNYGSATTIDSAFSYSLVGTTVKNLVLTGTGNINGTANDYGDHLTGNAGNNILTAGAANDTLTGGGGTDTFVFKLHTGHDIVSGFTGHDVIDISAFKSAGYHPTLTDVGYNTVIGFSDGDQITLLGVHKSMLIGTTAGFTH